VRSASLLLPCVALTAMSACAGSAVLEQIGSDKAPEQGTVVVGRSISETFQVTLDETRHKLAVEPTLTTALNLRVRQFTASTSSASVFEEAAQKFLEDRRGHGCRLSNPVETGSLAWEFDYTCP
jgi:hypothetical protein